MPSTDFDLDIRVATPDASAVEAFGPFTFGTTCYSCSQMYSCCKPGGTGGDC